MDDNNQYNNNRGDYSAPEQTDDSVYQTGDTTQAASNATENSAVDNGYAAENPYTQNTYTNYDANYNNGNYGTQDNTQYTAYNAAQNPYASSGNAMMQPPKKGCGLGVTSLVLGILSLTLCCVGGTLFGLAAIIFGIVSLCKKESKYGLGIAGIVTGVLGFLVGAYMLFVVVLAGMMYDNVKDMDPYEVEEWLEENEDTLEDLEEWGDQL